MVGHWEDVTDNTKVIIITLDSEGGENYWIEEERQEHWE